MALSITDLASAMQELGFSSHEDLEIVLAGTSTYEIDGSGSKWAPFKGTKKHDKDAFIIIRRKRKVYSSIPPSEFNPQHGVYEQQPNTEQ